MAKYEVWGRVAGRRKRLRFGMSSAADARREKRELEQQGHTDLVIVQRPATYGRLKSLQKRGL